MKPDFNLDDLPKKQPYRAPDDYFDKLPNRIMQRVTAEQKSAWSWLPTLPVPLRMAFASLLLLLTFVGVFYFNNQTETMEQSYTLASVSEQEILDYLLETEQLETADLTELAATNQDLTHYYIPASAGEIEATLENRDLEDIYL